MSASISASASVSASMSGSKRLRILARIRSSTVDGEFEPELVAGKTAYDANGSITDESFFGDGAEFYSWGEVGWSPSRAEQYFTNVHLMAWHVDEREDNGIPSSHGIAIGAHAGCHDLDFSRQFEVACNVA